MKQVLKNRALVTGLMAFSVITYCWWSSRSAEHISEPAQQLRDAHYASADMNSEAPAETALPGNPAVATLVTAQLDLFSVGLLTIDQDGMVPLAWTNDAIAVGARYDLARKCFYSAVSKAYYSNSLMVLATVVRDAQDEEMRNRALWMCGVGHEKLGNLDAAYEHLRALVDRCEMGIGAAVQMAALDALADVSRSMKKYDESIALNRRYIELSTTDAQRMSGQLMIIKTELERDVPAGKSLLYDFLRTAPDRQCGAYHYALRTYRYLKMGEELERRLATIAKPSDPREAEAIFNKASEDVTPKYFGPDGKPLPFNHNTEDHR